MNPLATSAKKRMQERKDFWEFCNSLDHCAKLIGYPSHHEAPEYDQVLLTTAFMEVMEEVETQPVGSDDSEFEWFDPYDVAERWGRLVLEQEIEFQEAS